MTTPHLFPYTPLPAENKSAWPPGPWHSEPDSASWTDTESGYQCAIIRNSHFGHLCGYVRVPESHLLFDRSYNTQVPVPKGWMERKITPGVDLGYISILCASVNSNPDLTEAAPELLFFCHGGLTYGNGNGWFGFDCSHCDDIIPHMLQYSEPHNKQIYREFPFVKSECTRLAKQLWEYQNLAFQGI